MGISDPVVWGSIVSVAICVVIFVYLIFKMKNLINKDTEAHKK